MERQPQLQDCLLYTSNERFFINNSAAAMEPMVTLENIKMKRLSGEVRYIVALLRAPVSYTHLFRNLFVCF